MRGIRSRVRQQKGGGGKKDCKENSAESRNQICKGRERKNLPSPIFSPLCRFPKTATWEGGKIPEVKREKPLQKKRLHRLPSPPPSLATEGGCEAPSLLPLRSSFPKGRGALPSFHSSLLSVEWNYNDTHFSFPHPGPAEHPPKTRLKRSPPPPLLGS